MGALEFRPARGPKPSEPRTAIELSHLVESARRAVRGRARRRRGRPRRRSRKSSRSARRRGGARQGRRSPGIRRQDEIRAGQFDVARGIRALAAQVRRRRNRTSELGVGQDYGRIEYAYHLMARGPRIAMTPCRLLEENGRAHFMTKRFDRDGNAKHHVQTLCALAHLDYRQKATHDVSQLFPDDRPAATGICGEGRGLPAHRVQRAWRPTATTTRRTSRSCLREGGAWELAPAYDVTYAYNPEASGPIST